MEESETNMRHATLVRGPDGALYILTESQKPLKVKDTELWSDIRGLIGEAEEKISRMVAESHRDALSGTHFIHIVIPKAVMKEEAVVPQY
jgi:hypothetical protein